MAWQKWSGFHYKSHFNIEEEEFASGGFKKAYKAKSDSPGFECSTWVVIRYLPSALEDIKESGQSVEEHTRKSVQMHCLARNFSLQLKEKVK